MPLTIIAAKASKPQNIKGKIYKPLFSSDSSLASLNVIYIKMIDREKNVTIMISFGSNSNRLSGIFPTNTPKNKTKDIMKNFIVCSN